MTHVHALILLGEASDGEHPRLRFLRGGDARVLGDDLRGHRQYRAASRALINPRHLQEEKGNSLGDDGSFSNRMKSIFVPCVDNVFTPLGLYLYIVLEGISSTTP